MLRESDGTGRRLLVHSRRGMTIEPDEDVSFFTWAHEQ
jgi:hypothetical protein